MLQKLKPFCKIIAENQRVIKASDLAHEKFRFKWNSAKNANKMGLFLQLGQRH